jgi:transmembrane sensor
VGDDARKAEPSGNPPQPPDERIIERHRDALKRLFPLPSAAELAPRKTRRKRAAPIVLGLLLAALIAWNPAYRHEHFATTTAQRASIDLPDGSRVVLDADSRIEVTMRLRSRHVALLAGRALFEVAPARWRPFHVDAGEARVRVVGTVFGVRRSDDGVAVTVVRGLVAVTPGEGNDTLVLRAGQHVDAHRRDIGKPVTVDAEAATSWTRGQLAFDHTPLREMVAQLQRYRRAPIELAGPGLGRLEVSGVFDSDRVDEALDLLPQILPVKVVRQADGSVRILAR